MCAGSQAAAGPREGLACLLVDDKPGRHYFFPPFLLVGVASFCFCPPLFFFFFFSSHVAAMQVHTNNFSHQWKIASSYWNKNLWGFCRGCGFRVHGGFFISDTVVELLSCTVCSVKYEKSRYGYGARTARNTLCVPYPIIPIGCYTI